MCFLVDDVFMSYRMLWSLLYSGHLLYSLIGLCVSQL